MKRLAKLYRQQLEVTNDNEARRIRRAIRREIRRRRNRQELLPSQQGWGWDGFAAIDNNYKWEDWN